MITPRPQKTLYTCDSNLDAFYIKNAIQRLAPIGVTIDRVDKKFKIIIDDCNFKVANIILMSSIRNLKRNANYNSSKNSEKATENRSMITMVFDYFGSHTQRGSFSRKIAS
ncbi:hypothetical protein [Wenyingzhuangia sp. 2_MG-2023]|uniref:hypothetical protein n=1 Tax=Wenyingzhuangia sp. 2_MG-2023 TaxID=3062639 RepID=UPI0026E459E5|nr:hypothetical protein [Wenyingzhuangia sp. 2_MG-2023]MDO6738002.1 hypothetical protein [Wenyingzhuangia sp. 2_MG-2023]